MGTWRRFVSRKVPRRVRETIVDALYPGLAWDGVAHEFVAWIGGSRVFVIDADAETCREESYPGDPGPARETGTNGRFRYFPSRDVFALVNAFEQDAFVLRRRGE